MKSEQEIEVRLRRKLRAARLCWREIIQFAIRREVLEVRCLPPPLGRGLSNDEQSDLQARIAALLHTQCLIEDELTELERQIAQLTREADAAEIAAMPNPYAGSRRVASHV
jgi:hypothetical protein